MGKSSQRGTLKYGQLATPSLNIFGARFETLWNKNKWRFLLPATVLGRRGGGGGCGCWGGVVAVLGLLDGVFVFVCYALFRGCVAAVRSMVVSKPKPTACTLYGIKTRTPIWRPDCFRQHRHAAAAAAAWRRGEVRGRRKAPASTRRQVGGVVRWVVAGSCLRC